MNTEARQVLRRLVQERSTLALGTLQADKPYVSLAPFAVSPTGMSLIIHASQLAAHTQNMQENPQVSALVSEQEDSGKMPQSLARATIQGLAREVSNEEPGYPLMREAYLRRFPDSAPMFDFTDFHLFLIDVISVRLITGFAQAITVNADSFAATVHNVDGEVQE